MQQSQLRGAGGHLVVEAELCKSLTQAQDARQCSGSGVALRAIGHGLLAPHLCVDGSHIVCEVFRNAWGVLLRKRDVRAQLLWSEGVQFTLWGWRSTNTVHCEDVLRQFAVLVFIRPVQDEPHDVESAATHNT